MTAGKTIALSRWTFVDKVMSLLLNLLSGLVIIFLPRSVFYFHCCNHHLWWFWSPPKIKSATVSTISPSICHEVMGPDAMILVFWMLEKLALSQLCHYSNNRELTWGRQSCKKTVSSISKRYGSGDVAISALDETKTRVWVCFGGGASPITPARARSQLRGNSFFNKVFLFLIFIYLVASGLSWGMRDLSLWFVGSIFAARKVSYPKARGMLVPWAGIEPMSPALEGRFLTVGPPTKSLVGKF